MHGKRNKMSGFFYNSEFINPNVNFPIIVIIKTVFFSIKIIITIVYFFIEIVAIVNILANFYNIIAAILEKASFGIIIIRACLF